MPNYDLTTKDVAMVLACSPATVWLYYKRGHFPHAYKLDPTSRRNSPLRIPLDDLAAFLDKRQAKPARSLPLD